MTKTTITSAGAIKKFATAAAIAGALGLGALGAAGAAAAAPGAHHNPGPKTTGSSEHAGPAAEHGEAEVVAAHVIPGFPLSPTSAPASGVPASAVPMLGVPAAAASAPDAVIPGGGTPDLLPTPSSRSDLPHPGWSRIPNACGSAGCSDIVDR